MKREEKADICVAIFLLCVMLAVGRLCGLIHIPWLIVIAPIAIPILIIYVTYMFSMIIRIIIEIFKD